VVRGSLPPFLYVDLAMPRLPILTFGFVSSTYSVLYFGTVGDLENCSRYKSSFILKGNLYDLFFTLGLLEFDPLYFLP
jgi:hypothetical protein